MTTQNDKDRLERIATAAMQGDLANSDEGCWGEKDAAQLAQRAVTFARALIIELDKEK